MRKLCSAILIATVLMFSVASYATINLTTNIVVPNIVKWKVVKFYDDDTATPPYAIVTVEMRGPGANGSALLYGSYPLYISNGTCYTLARNAAATSYNDFVTLSNTSIPTAYTTITEAFDNASGTKVQKRAAIEPVLISTGIMIDLGGT